MTGPRWLSEQSLKLLHDMSIAEHGGMSGLRDQGLLESAMMRPVNLFEYGSVSDIASLAAAYAFGLAKNHPFNDGNKRAAFLAMVVFIEKNGLVFVAEQLAAYDIIMRLAAGEVAEDELAGWIRDNVRPK
jgi:death-on-curing protein